MGREKELPMTHAGALPLAWWRQIKMGGGCHYIVVTMLVGRGGNTIVLHSHTWIRDYFTHSITSHSNLGN